MEKRAIDIVVISDVHLGTYGSKAKELNRYLSSINPKTLVLNGDIIDIWQFSKNYWPDSHMLVLKQIISMLSRGVRVCYITGNHDEMLRKFQGFTLSNFSIENKLTITHPNGEKSWIFHGDVFDVTMRYSKWLAKLGAVGYDLLIHLNTFINWINAQFGYGKISLSKKIKNSVKKALQFIDQFEETAIQIALEKGYNNVICGHIHQPAKKTKYSGEKMVTYLNSGDWVEHLTALEYTNNEWILYQYSEDQVTKNYNDLFFNDEAACLRVAELYKQMLQEFRA